MNVVHKSFLEKYPGFESSVQCTPLVLWLRGYFGAVMGPLGAEHGCVLAKVRSEASTRRVSLLSEALIQNLKLLSKKLWVLWLKGCFRAVMSPLGTAHEGFPGLMH